jgi:5-formyltetrahydrofolate cyclo-ligase
MHRTGQEDRGADLSAATGRPGLVGAAGTPGFPGAPEPPERSGASSPAGGLRSARLDMPGLAGPNQASSTGPGGASSAGPDRDTFAAPDLAVLAEAKAALRARVLAARRAMTADQRSAAGHQLRDAMLELPEMQMAGTVAAYVSMGQEPDTRGLLFALWKRGTYVLLPMLRPDGDLNWASYEGPDSLAPGPRGLLEPTEPPRGVTAITSADLIIVPALAVDGAGRRLGRGGGSYDRALARVGAAILTVALLYDGELIGQVPAGGLDQPVRAAAVPGEGISRLR